MDLRETIPAYGLALDAESLIRDAPFLTASEFIGPFCVRMMTLRDYLALKRHPILKGFQPTVGDLVVFIRYLWAGNRLDHSLSNALAKWLFGKRCFRYVKANFPLVDDQCLRYVTETFTDAVQPKGIGWNPQYYSEAVGYVAMFSRHHHWIDEKTLSMPMKLLLQFKREIEHSSGETPCNHSDKLIVDHTLAMRRN